MNETINILCYQTTNRGNLNIYAPQALEDMTALSRVINPSSQLVTEETLSLFFKRGGILAFACDGDRMVGCASIVYVSRTNGTSAQLENVSVLPTHNGYGISKKLIGMLIVDVRMMGYAKEIDLTCKPSRKAANHVYEKLGFKLRETNVRRLLIADTLRP
jgi:ribosomal protein S18 acetylase RimI-like enzyme